MAENAFIEFPRSRGILWDRSPRSHPRFLRSKDVLPSLFVGPGTVRPFLQQLMQSSATNSTLEKVISVRHVSELADDDLKALKARSLKTAVLPNYVLDVCDGGHHSQGGQSEPKKAGVNKDMCLTIPIVMRDVEQVQGPFGANATAQLISNLGKSIRSAREFSLRSCVRIRATGAQSLVEGGSGSSGGSLKGSFRFEAVLPDVSFQLVSVNPLPVLPTPLSLSLCRQAHAAGPKMGFLTLNQMRKAVPLLETDLALPAVPVVGVWAVAPCGGGDSPLEHPVVWAAALRFLGSELVRERVWVAPKTFLLALFDPMGESAPSSSSSIRDGQASPRFFEVTWVQPPVPDAQVPLALRSLDEFLVLDFSMDLLAEGGDDGSACPAAMGCFRQLTRTDHLATLRDAGEILLPGSTANTATRSFEVPASMTRAQDAGALANRMAVAASWSPALALEGATPVPRIVVPVPLPSLAAAPAHVDPASEQASFRSTTSTHGHGHGHGIPSEIILAQQMQIDALRNQVDELRRIVMAMGSAGGSGSGSGSGSMRDAAMQDFHTAAPLKAPTLSADPVVVEASTCMSEQSAASRASAFSMQLSDDDDESTVLRRERGDPGAPSAGGMEGVSELGSCVMGAEDVTTAPMNYLDAPSIPNIDQGSGRLTAACDGDEAPDLKFDDGDEDYSGLGAKDLKAGLSVSLEAFMPSMALPSSITLDLRPDYVAGVLEEESESILAIQAKYR